jgi:hypothetical protein
MSENETKPKLIPEYMTFSREGLAVLILVSAFLGSVLHEKLRNKVPGFEYRDGDFFEGCYEKTTRVQIALCLDQVWNDFETLRP